MKAVLKKVMGLSLLAIASIAAAQSKFPDGSIKMIVPFAPGGGVDSAANAGVLINDVDNALKYVNSARASLGAIQNRFGSVIGNFWQIVNLRKKIETKSRQIILNIPGRGYKVNA